VRQYDTKRLMLPNYCIPCFMCFMLYTVCKTMRLSVFNKELLDCWLGNRKGIRPVTKTGCRFVGG